MASSQARKPANRIPVNKIAKSGSYTQLYPVGVSNRNIGLFRFETMVACGNLCTRMNFGVHRKLYSRPAL